MSFNLPLKLRDFASRFQVRHLYLLAKRAYIKDTSGFSEDYDLSVHAILASVHEVGLTSLPKSKCESQIANHSDAKADPASQTFDRFGDLPMERQIEVWKMVFDAEDPDRMRSDDDPCSSDARYLCYVLFSSPWSWKDLQFYHMRGRRVRRSLPQS